MLFLLLSFFLLVWEKQLLVIWQQHHPLVIIDLFLVEAIKRINLKKNIWNLNKFFVLTGGSNDFSNFNLCSSSNNINWFSALYIYKKQKKLFFEKKKKNNFYTIKIMLVIVLKLNNLFLLHTTKKKNLLFFYFQKKKNFLYILVMLTIDLFYEIKLF